MWLQCRWVHTLCLRRKRSMSGGANDLFITVSAFCGIFVMLYYLIPLMLCSGTIVFSSLAAAAGVSPLLLHISAARNEKSHCPFPLMLQKIDKHKTFLQKIVNYQIKQKEFRLSNKRKHWGCPWAHSPGLAVHIRTYRSDCPLWITQHCNQTTTTSLCLRNLFEVQTGSPVWKVSHEAI